VNLLQQHVSHVPVAGIHDDSLDPPDIAIGSVDMIAASHRYLAFGYSFTGDGLRTRSVLIAGPSMPIPAAPKL
jgi:hypothetical protein